MTDTTAPDGDDDTRGLAARNRAIIAARLHWPSGVIDRLTELEDRHPDWAFNYDTGGLPACPDPVYTARLRAHRFGAKTLKAATAAQLDQAVRRASGEAPRHISGF